MAPRTRRVPTLGFCAVVVEDPQRQVIDRVLLYASETTAEAEEPARAFLADRKPPLRYRFAAQPISEVSGPGGAQYRVVLRRLPARER